VSEVSQIYDTCEVSKIFDRPGVSASAILYRFQWRLEQLAAREASDDVRRERSEVAAAIEQMKVTPSLAWLWR
jgi:hypothetical protein